MTPPLEGTLTRESLSMTLVPARVFFIFPQFIMNSDKFTECDFKDHLYGSATSAGLTGAYFYEDDISYPGLKPTPKELAQQKLRELREAILQFRPDFIVYDACFDGSADTVNVDFLRDIKKDTGARTIGFMADAWGQRWRDALRYWGQVTDRLIYIMPPKPEQLREPKLLSIPYPCNPLTFYPPRSKDIEVSFLGTNYEWRLPFIAAAIEVCKENALRYHILAHGRTNECPNMEGYADIVRRSKIVFNLVKRHDGTPIVTGRVWQAIHSRCLLLEEDNDETAKYFTLGEHYIPFITVGGLRNAIMQGIETWGTNPIPKAAYDYCQANYSAAGIWDKILDGLR